jgi:hypothetical protein
MLNLSIEKEESPGKRISLRRTYPVMEGARKAQKSANFASTCGKLTRPPAA